jgi:hypothetical protein
VAAGSGRGSWGRPSGRRRCHGAWLDTSSVRAERFYGRLGYRPFGALGNGAGERPEGHRRVFMRKCLPHHREPVASLGV